MNNDEVTIKLNKDMALILFEVLSRFDEITNEEKSSYSLIFDDDAEIASMNEMHGQLEMTLVEPFHEDYWEKIKEAKNRIMEKCGKYT